MLGSSDFVVRALVEQGRLTAEQAELAAREAALRQVGVAEAAVALGWVDARAVGIARAAVCEVPFVDLSHYRVNYRNAGLLPRSLAERHAMFPLFVMGRSAVVAMADPMDLAAMDKARASLRTEIDVVLAEPARLAALIERAYSMAPGDVGEEEPRGGAEAGAAVPGGVGLGEPGIGIEDEQPIVAAVNQILSQAIEERASDVHICPDDGELHLRLRIDGVMQSRQGPGMRLHGGIVQRIKVMSHLDLTQTRRPQDGKFRFSAGERAVDMRVSIIPTVYGETVVIRLLNTAGVPKGFEELGVSVEMIGRLERMLAEPYGMLVATGPTGSGKTTTLYAGLSRLNTPDVAIVTIEDPVEMRMGMVRQVQVNAEIGLSFAAALRSVLRQDPDIILVGEIRDEETARIALQSALTGHLVLTTLHTNDAVGAVPRLRDLGVPGFAINAGLLGSVGQRLARRVCADCAEGVAASPEMLMRLGLEIAERGFVRGRGCGKCLGTGFRGRLGVYEILELSPGVRAAVEGSGGGGAIYAAAERDGWRPLWRDALEKARLGLTTLEEVSLVAAAAMLREEAGAAAGDGPDGGDRRRGGDRLAA